MNKKCVVITAILLVAVGVWAQYPDNVDLFADCVGSPQPTNFQMSEAWRSITEVNNYVSPVVGDIDGDNKAEIFAVVPQNETFNGGSYHIFDRIAIFKGNNRNNPTIINTVEGRNINVSSLALAKVPYSSGISRFLVFMIGLYDGKIYAYDAVSASSVPVWISSVTAYPGYTTNYDENIYATSLNLADFNNDGIPEIYCGSRIFDASTGNFLCEIPAGNNMGKSTYNNFYQFTSATQQLTIAADVLGDRRLELCAGTQVFNVNINSLTNSSLNSVTVAASLPTSSSYWVQDGKTIVADIDQDGYLDVIVSDINGNELQTLVWNPRNNTLIAKGGIAWSQPQNYPFIAVPLVGNIDANPDLEIVQVSYNVITAYRLNRATSSLDVVYNETVSDPSGGTGITLFDFNQDGIMELVYRDEQQLRIMAANHSTSDFTNQSVFSCYAGTGFEHPIVADVDNDQQAEIVVIGGNNNSQSERQTGRLRIYKSSGAAWAPARRVWNQYAYNVVNVNEDLSIPQYQFNPATFFAGNDRAMNTADDIQPFNSFLQQQTTLDKFGEPFWALSEHQDTIYDSFCKNSTYSFYNQQINTPGKYKHRVVVNNDCDTIVTLFLTEKATDSLAISGTICPNTSYNFNSRVLTQAGVYIDTLVNHIGCDSIVRLDLKMLPESHYSYKDTSYKCEYYYFGGDSINTSGIYTDTLTSHNGCDSIVQLELLVRPRAFNDTLSICPDRLPLTVYDTTFSADAVSGIYVIKHRCATITFVLNVMPNVRTDTPQLPEICADGNSFNITFPPSNDTHVSFPTNYKLTFDSKAQNNGLENTDGVFNGNTYMTVTIPDSIVPDYYNCTIELCDSTANCATQTYTLTLPVLYSAKVLTQMWNDVIAVLNERYNGGYRFSAFAWYKNGTLIPDENRSFIYIGNGGTLDFGHKYQAMLTRSNDGVQILTCPFIPTPHTDITQYPTVVGNRSRFALNSRQNMTLQIYSATGTMVSTQNIVEGSNSIEAPAQKGIYIMLFLKDGYRVHNGKLVVK